MHSFIVLIVLALAVTAGAKESWFRYRVFVPDEAAAQRIADSSLGLFSDEIALGETDLIVGPGQMDQLKALRVPYRLIQELPNPKGWAGMRQDHPPDYRYSYLRYADILAWYESWRAQYPSIVRRQQIGTSHEGRPIWVYRLHTPYPGDRAYIQAEHSVVLLGACHAREWISPPVVMYLFHTLLTSAQSSRQFQTLANRIELSVIPVLNPDGYEYTWLVDRFWRKNRRNNLNGSFGVDLNRNYSTAWGGQGSSGNTSSDIYRGPAPFSEPETSALRNYVAAIKAPLRGFIDYHSYAQKILWPWSYTYSPPPDAVWLNSIGESYRQGILGAGGLNYQNGQASVILYIASGTSKDWSYETYTAASYTIELRDTGQYGFLLPENQILPTQTENWGGFVAFLQRMIE